MFFLPTAILAFLTLTLALATPAPANTSLSLPPSTATPASAAATTDCLGDNFVKPWEISNLVMVNPAGSDNAVHMSFSFFDRNEKLALTTTCIAIANEDGTAVMANGGYVACQNNEVRFQMQDAETLSISRWYRDPCMGKPPYDTAIALGDAPTTMGMQKSAAGTVRFQPLLLMNVSMMT